MESNDARLKANDIGIAALQVAFERAVSSKKDAVPQLLEVASWAFSFAAPPMDNRKPPIGFRGNGEE